LIDINILNAAAASVIDQDMEKAEAIAHKAIEDGLDPIEIISKGFTVGITKVGDLFDKGELFLPELIICSEIMKNVIGILNDSIPTEDMKAGAKVVITTVEGDVHDIGKGIVVSLFNAHGLEV